MEIYSLSWHSETSLSLNPLQKNWLFPWALGWLSIPDLVLYISLVCLWQAEELTVCRTKVGKPRLWRTAWEIYPTLQGHQKPCGSQTPHLHHHSVCIWPVYTHVNCHNVHRWPVYTLLHLKLSVEYFYLLCVNAETSCLVPSFRNGWQEKRSIYFQHWHFFFNIFFLWLPRIQRQTVF